MHHSALRSPHDPSEISKIRIDGTAPAPGSASSVDIDQVQTVDAIPYIRTARQKALSIIPGGSVRTQGSLAVQHATNALGKVIVYTHPSGTGHLPALRPRLVSSATVTSDATLLSGARNPIGPTGTIYRLPAPVVPRGRCEVWAWLRANITTGDARVAWSVASYMGSTQLTSDFTETTVNFPVVSAWKLVRLGTATMPDAGLGPTGFAQVAPQRRPLGLLARAGHVGYPQLRT